VIYTDYIYLFQAAGLILLVAMIGAIVLTLRDKPTTTKRQDIATQIARSSVLQMTQPALGQGIRREEILRPLPPPAKEAPKQVEHGGQH
jgi:NADH-quinone oxidoreductase subunit J